MSDIDFETKRRLVISVLNQNHGGFTYQELNGANFFFDIQCFWINYYYYFVFNFLDQYREQVGESINSSTKKAKQELAQMKDVVLFVGKYLSTSRASQHVCRSMEITPKY